MRAVVLLVLTAAGCFTKPEPPNGAVDAPRPDGSTACTFDSFESNLSPCLPWGTSYGNATISVAGGTASITPASGIGANGGGCFATGMVAFTDGGVAMDVVQLPSSSSGYLKLIVGDDATKPEIGTKDGMVLLSNEPGVVFASATYVPAAMRWWRLRPDRARGVYIADTSGDGAVWNKLGETVGLGAPPAMIRFQFDAGVTANEAIAGTAVIAELAVCPP